MAPRLGPVPQLVLPKQKLKWQVIFCAVCDCVLWILHDQYLKWFVKYHNKLLQELIFSACPALWIYLPRNNFHMAKPRLFLKKCNSVKPETLPAAVSLHVPDRPAHLLSLMKHSFRADVPKSWTIYTGLVLLNWASSHRPVPALTYNRRGMSWTEVCAVTLVLSLFWGAFSSFSTSIVILVQGVQSRLDGVRVTGETPIKQSVLGKRRQQHHPLVLREK